MRDFFARSLSAMDRFFERYQSRIDFLHRNLSVLQCLTLGLVLGWLYGDWWCAPLITAMPLLIRWLILQILRAIDRRDLAEWRRMNEHLYMDESDGRAL